MLARQSLFRMMQFSSRAFAVQVGDSVPSVEVPIVRFKDGAFAHEKFNLAEYCKNKHVVVVGYPGAFTPTCMATHIPEYITNAEKIKSTKGVDEILALSVNDPFVVKAFAEHLGGKDKINYIADGNGELTRALGQECDLSVAHLAKRGNRMSLVIKGDKVI